ncbi:hypothetical protein [Streptomyces sp. CA-111067]|uniref:hypothetical protein n=1 Tax=Streptomyces sp. CA-111067 TaxID=3240046 RepID=UPI003D95220F
MGAGRGSDGSFRSDEEWERFLRESVEGAADAPKEPSARAREVTRRLRAESGRGLESGRTYPPARPRRHTGWYAAGLLTCLVLLVVAVAPGRVVDLFGGSDSSSQPTGASQP